VRILAVGNMYPPHHTGGYELVWQAAMRHAGSLGHEVRVLTSDHREAGVRQSDEGDVRRTLRWYWDPARYEFPRLGPLARLRIERHNAAELERHLASFRPDVVAWWSMGCMSLALIERVRRAGIRAVFVVHDDWLIYGPHRDQWIRMWRGRRRALAPAAERLFGIPTSVELDRAGRFAFNSRYTLGRARGAGIDAPTMTVVHPGVDERFLEAAPPRPWRWQLAYVGRIDRQKGIDTAVRAIALLPEPARLSVWGTGDQGYLAELRSLAAGLGVAGRIRFPGRASLRDLPSIYADSDAVVFPVRWQEPFGLVPLEAMGVGRPVLTTARGGTAEFIRHGENALVFDPDDEAGLARAIRRLADDESLRARLRLAGMQTAARHTLARFAERIVEEIAGPVSERRLAAGAAR